MKNSISGFSLIELIVVLFISGLTLASLTHMMLLSFNHYDFINENNIKHIYTDNIRIWLRDYIEFSQNFDNDDINISVEDFSKSIKLKDKMFINELKFIKHNNGGYFVKVSVCYDKNGNKLAEKDECDDKLFFFRRRV